MNYNNGDKILIETWNNETKENEWLPGEYVKQVTALDRDFRHYVKYDNGQVCEAAAPECIKPAESTTPVGDAYHARLLLMNTTPLPEVKDIAVGDYIKTERNERTSGVSGFVKKIARKNMIVETTYGGWGGSDVELMEIKVAIADVTTLHKPKN